MNEHPIRQSDANAPRALIAGGGIGGLVAALTLHRAGIRGPRVRGRAGSACARRRHQPAAARGAGARAASACSTALRASGIETGSLLYVNKFGQRIWQEARGIEAGYPIPQISIHRGELHMILYRAVQEQVGPDAVTCGAALVGRTTQDGDGVTAHFVDRQTGAPLGSERGALLVGADGIHSALRKMLVPERGPAAVLRLHAVACDHRDRCRSSTGAR